MKMGEHADKGREKFLKFCGRHLRTAPRVIHDAYICLTVCELPRVVLHVAVVVLRVLVADLVAELVVGRVLHEAHRREEAEKRKSRISAI